MELRSSNLLITGGGAGIGRALVEHLTAQVARIAVLEISASACGQIEKEFANVRCYPCDVADHESVGRAVAHVYDDGFDVDVLINNAGLIYSAPLIDMLSKDERMHSVQMWRRTLSVNLDSVFYVTREVVNRMLLARKKGVVINISSISANGNAGQSAYAAAKAGVNALTRTWAKELGVMGLRFVSIAPGFLDTPSTRDALSSAVLDKIKRQVPLCRLGAPQHVGQAVRYVIENDYVNGTVLEVDGGLVI